MSQPPSQHAVAILDDAPRGVLHDGLVGPLELAVADRLAALCGVDPSPSVRVATALAAAAPRSGHVCVQLDEVLGPVRRRDDDAAVPVLVELPPPDRWRAELLATPLARDAREEGPTTPLVLDGHRCYLDRYWDYEERLRLAVLARAGEVERPSDLAAVSEVLDRVVPRLPPGPGDPPTDRQRLAVASALLRPLTVLSGGPGTGKTHTVVSLVAAHLLLAGRRGQPVPRIALAAPTGKAAARMEEAVRDALRDPTLPGEVRGPLEEVRGFTLHRLLGTRWDRPTKFQHDADEPLVHDLVVVDEASMVPLSMVTKLLEAVAPDATLVLVGDRDQLVSVEAGAVLGDLCGPRPHAGRSSLRLSEGWGRLLGAATDEPVAEDRDPVEGTGVWDCVIQLERFFRFSSDSGIGGVARAVRLAGDDAGTVLRLLGGHVGTAAGDDGATSDRDTGPTQPSLLDELDRPDATGTPVDAGHEPLARDVRLLRPDERGRLPTEVRRVIVDAARPLLRAAADGDAPLALELLDEVRMLCATRSGPLGVDDVRDVVERWLDEDLDHDVTPGGVYVGRPVLVTRNDHDLGLMNGDVGITLDRGGHLVVVFPDAGREDGVREVAAVRLPPHETVWAMTIHKAQGSQFRHAVVVLPTHDSRVLSRELVYTGVTRARDQLTVVANPDVLAAAVTRPVRRATGLADRLWPQR